GIRDFHVTGVQTCALPIYFAPELLELYDFYAHGIIDRREFLSRASRFAAGGLSAAALLAAMSPDYALAEQVSFTDPDIHAEYLRSEERRVGKEYRPRR